MNFIKVDNGLSATISGDNLVYSGATDGFKLGGVDGNAAHLSMANLARFEFDNPTQAFSISGQATGVGSRTAGSLRLATDNIITTSHFGVGDVARNSLGGGSINDGTVELGQNNTINADTIAIGAQNANGQFRFHGDITAGQLTLRGTEGGDSRVAQWLIGTTNAYAINGGSGNVNLSGGTLDARVRTLLIGSGYDSFVNSSLLMAAGTLDADLIVIGQRTGSTRTGRASGTLIINSGDVLTQRLIIGDIAEGIGEATGVVNLQNGATLRARSIEAGAGSATRAINWDAGTIGNYAEGDDMRIDGVDIKLSDVGTHEFRIDGASARATVNAVLSDANASGPGGTLLKTGDGMLILEDTNTYRGATTVNDGTLIVNGALSNSNTTVNGGALAGSGTVRNVSVGNGGAISNAMGTLTVDGDLEFDAAGIYRFAAYPPESDNRIDVTGNASLQGKLDIRATGGNFEQDRHFTILTTAGEQTGAFSALETDLAFLTPKVTYNEHDVELDLQRNDIRYSGVAETHNQLAVAAALEAISATPVGDNARVIDAVTALSVDQARAAYDAIGGVGLTAVRRTAPAFASSFNNQLRARLATVNASNNTLRTALDQPALLAADAQVSKPIAEQTRFSLGEGNPRNAYGRGLWMRGYGSEQSLGSDNNAAASRSKLGGFSAGFDALVSNDLVLGAAFSHGRTVTTAEHEKGDANGNALALYASYTDGPWDVLGSAAVAQTNISTERHIAFGSIDRTATASFKMHTVAVAGEVGYSIPMAGWTLQPLTGLSINYSRDKGFTENGAGSLNLQVAAEMRSAIQSQLGLRALFNTGSVQWQPRAVWTHAFGNTNAPMSAQLQDTGAVINLRGVALPRDALVTGMTVAAQANEQVSLFADIQGEFGSRQTNLGLLFGMRATW